MDRELIRRYAKEHVPSPVRRVLRSGLHISQRIGRWPIILWQVRGVRSSDARALTRSALAAPRRALFAPLEWQDPVLVEDTEVLVRGVGRFSLRAHSDDLWHVLPWREQAIVEALRSRLRPGDIFVDAGANIGVYTVLASQLVGASGRVIAVEMMPQTADRLEHHVRINDLRNVTVIRGALSSKPGHAVVATVQPGKYGQASIAARAVREGEEQIEVRTTTLDDICHGLARVRMMKMDLEGAELDALLGGDGLVQRTEFVVYESWGAHRAEKNPVDQCLTDAGFAIERLDGNNRLARRGPDRA